LLKRPSNTDGGENKLLREEKSSSVEICGGMKLEEMEMGEGQIIK